MTLINQRLKNENFSFRKMIIDDLDLLRENKNNNKEFFFLKEDITPKKQLEWFEYMQEQKDNFMFIFLDCADNKFGCIGYRKINNVVDIYNVMRFGISNVPMHKCLNKIIEDIEKKYESLPIQVLVLENNPAIKWYEKNGFNIVEHKDNFVKMILKK